MTTRYDDFRDDGCKPSALLDWCMTHEISCDQQPVKICPGCGAKFRYAHLNCIAVQPVTLTLGQHLQVTYELRGETSSDSKTVFRTGPGGQYGTIVGDQDISFWGGAIVIHDTFNRADGNLGSSKAGSDGWVTTQTVVPNTASVEQRQELLRALREDPSMGQRSTRQFVATIDKKRVTTASVFDNAFEIGLWQDIVLSQRQDSTMAAPPGLTCTLETLPDDEWVHVIIKPTRPNDLGILALRRNGLLLQVHEVTSGARSKSEFPGVDRVFPMITPR